MKKNACYKDKLLAAEPNELQETIRAGLLSMYKFNTFANLNSNVCIA